MVIMKGAAQFQREVKALLDTKERDLLDLRETVWKFLDTTHTASDVKEYQTKVRAQENEVSIVFRWLLDPKDKPKEFAAFGDALCKRCRDLGQYSKAMTDALNEDYKIVRETEKSKTEEVIKGVTFFLAVPGFCIAAHKAGVVNNYLTITQATALGFGASTATLLFHKEISGGFKNAKETLCARVKNSFLLYCIKEMLKENGRVISGAINRYSPIEKLQA
jgi:hypothetical protein